MCASHPSDNGCQEPAVFGAGKETRRQLGCYAASYPQNEQTALCWLKRYFNVMKLFLTITILLEVCLFVWFFGFVGFVWGCSYLFCTLGSRSSQPVQWKESLTDRLPPSMQLGVFPLDMICLTKVPAEVNTSLTYSKSSLRSIFVIF